MKNSKTLVALLLSDATSAPTPTPLAAPRYTGLQNPLSCCPLSLLQNPLKPHLSWFPLQNLALKENNLGN